MGAISLIHSYEFFPHLDLLSRNGVNPSYDIIKLIENLIQQIISIPKIRSPPFFIFMLANPFSLFSNLIWKGRQWGVSPSISLPSSILCPSSQFKDLYLTLKWIRTPKQMAYATGNMEINVKNSYPASATVCLHIGAGCNVICEDLPVWVRALWLALDDCFNFSRTLGINLRMTSRAFMFSMLYFHPQQVPVRVSAVLLCVIKNCERKNIVSH